MCLNLKQQQTNLLCFMCKTIINYALCKYKFGKFTSHTNTNSGSELLPNIYINALNVSLDPVIQRQYRGQFHFKSWTLNSYLHGDHVIFALKIGINLGQKYLDFQFGYICSICFLYLPPTNYTDVHVGYPDTLIQI